MWHTNPNMNQSQNLPSVLKNFNAFDLLEPEKVNLESADVSTAVLKDVTDSMDRQEKLLDLSSDLHGSFLEKVKKTEFDLLDLYQNIYVTPQEIKMEPREDCCDKSKNSDPEFETFKIDFTELFEKAEQGKKLSDWTKDTENVNKATKNIPQLNFSNETLRSFDEIFDNAISTRCSQLKLEPPPKLELDIPKQDICEDDIDEFLQPKLVIDPSRYKETAQNISSFRPISHFKNDTPPASSISLNDVKTEAEKISFTKGPQIYGKSIVSRKPIKNTIYLMHKGGKEERPAKPGAYKKSEGFLKPEMSLKLPAYYLEPGTSVALKPKVLMEDCSIKRVKALQTRIAFEKFFN